jgi:hypothetical protein
LRSLGFREYFSALAASNKMIKDDMKPPLGAVEVFMGCGKVNSNVLQIGAVATPAELFDQRDYRTYNETDAKAVRNYYAYYSTSYLEPIGFSKTSKIRLYWADVNDFYDESILSGTTKYRGSTLLRCGSAKGGYAGFSYYFYSSYKIVFYSR